MDHILHKVVGLARISLLDIFSSYNQVLVHLDDQAKTSFTTPWGTFMYVKISFSLMNVGATFQRVMSISFPDEVGRFIAIYLDDIIVFSKIEEDHFFH